MERVIDLYEKDYDEQYPILSLDERPCQLLDNIMTPLLPKPGSCAKEDYHYKRMGTCCVLMAIEPKTGKRIVEVRETRKKTDYKEFLEKVAESYPNAKKITVIQDNLNTHNPSSFYENMEPKNAFDLMNRFDMVYTPKKASWLNVIEIEFAALSKQCLDRRIPTTEELRKEVLSWTAQREADEIKINWLFSKEKARKKMSSKYDKIRTPH